MTDQPYSLEQGSFQETGNRLTSTAPHHFNQPNNQSVNFDLNKLERTDKNRQFCIMSNSLKKKGLTFVNSFPSIWCQAGIVGLD
jgi:hypothetical protein